MKKTSFANLRKTSAFSMEEKRGWENRMAFQDISEVMEQCLF